MSRRRRARQTSTDIDDSGSTMVHSSEFGSDISSGDEASYSNSPKRNMIHEESFSNSDSF